jgi:linoleoyl-CoA desaturase
MQTNTVQLDQIEVIKNLRSAVRRQIKEDTPNVKGGLFLFVKAIIILSLFLGVFALFCVLIPNVWFSIPLGIIAGFLMASVGMAVMHDANHGAFSQNANVNALFGAVLYLIGGYPPNWKMQHNFIHHTFTNTSGRDDDIDHHNHLFRFNPHQPWRWYHKYQKYYVWPIYSLMSLTWVVRKDFKAAWKYHIDDREGYEQIEQYRVHVVKILISKILYYAFWIGLPLYLGVPFWSVIAFFFAMHFTAGLWLGIIFQPAHVNEKTQFLESWPEPGELKREIHQILTSSNFAMSNWFLTQMVGGLNFQIEHHLFPDIAHKNYPKIAPIVRKFCKQRGINYNDLGSFGSAVKAHYHYLGKMGEKPASKKAFT